MKRSLWLLCFALYLCASFACKDDTPIYRSYLPPLGGAPSHVMLAQAPLPSSAPLPTTKSESGATKLGVVGPAPAGVTGRILGKNQGEEEAEEDGDKSCQVDLNSAPSALLQTLPGIGPATAKKIIEAREKRPFSRPSQIQRVKGIGRATYKKIKPLVCTMPPGTPEAKK